MSDYLRTDFMQGIAQLLFYRTVNGNLDVPESYVTAERFPLGEFVKDVRGCYQENRLTGEQEKRLAEIGLSLDETQQTWESMFLLARDYVMLHDGKIPGPTERTADNILLGAWVRKQRFTYHNLRRDQQDCLRRIGIYA